jgi:hypothetical protein
MWKLFAAQFPKAQILLRKEPGLRAQTLVNLETFPSALKRGFSFALFARRCIPLLWLHIL